MTRFWHYQAHCNSSCVLSALTLNIQAVMTYLRAKHGGKGIGILRAFLTGQESIKEVTGGSISGPAGSIPCETGLSGPCAEGMTKHGDPLWRVGGIAASDQDRGS